MVEDLDGQVDEPMQRRMTLFSTNEIAGLVVFYGRSLIDSGISFFPAKFILCFQIHGLG